MKRGKEKFIADGNNFLRESCLKYTGMHVVSADLCVVHGKAKKDNRGVIMTQEECLAAINKNINDFYWINIEYICCR